MKRLNVLERATICIIVLLIIWMVVPRIDTLTTIHFIFAVLSAVLWITMLRNALKDHAPRN